MCSLTFANFDIYSNLPYLSPYGTNHNKVNVLRSTDGCQYGCSTYTATGVARKKYRRSTDTDTGVVIQKYGRSTNILRGC